MLGVFSIFNNVVLAEEIIRNIITAPLVISATRIETNSFDVPVSIDVVDKSAIQDGQLDMTLSESLIRVPGLTAQNRTQFAQDPQISTRGFGARSIFGVSGVRLYVDGIPLTMPDGIGQPGNVDLETIKSIEVMRGPFSSMYGSASGGVISLFTKDAPKDNEISTSFLAGSYGTSKESAQATGTIDGIGYLLNQSNFNTDGYREHSAAHKDQSTAQIKFVINDDTRVIILANYLKMFAQDPLGLAGSGSTYNPKIPNILSNPQSVPFAATAANTRVYRENTQVGINLEHDIDTSNTINLISYAGHRNNSQFLSTSTTTSAGRDSRISRDFWGTELNWTNKGEFLNKKYVVTSGISFSSQTDDRFDINASAGVVNTSTPNRNEQDTATDFDEYAQGQLSVFDNVDLHAGVRNIHTILGVNPFTSPRPSSLIKSGSLNFINTTPVVGIVWKLRPEINLYANYGKGFQSPNLIQIAYNSSSGGGPNLGLSGSSSDNYEAGMKVFVSDNTRLNLAVFKVVTSNEISLLNDSGASYTQYWNLPVPTTRTGIELSIDSQLPYNLGLYGAYTLLNAKYDGAFQEATALSVNNSTVNAGNSLPGTYKNQLYGELSWKNPDIVFTTALEGRVNGKVYANDLNTADAPGYAIVNIRAGFKQIQKGWQFSEYARVENIFDRNYISAVRVNDLNGEFYEPGAGRNIIIGISASLRL